MCNSKWASYNSLRGHPLHKSMNSIIIHHFRSIIPLCHMKEKCYFVLLLLLLVQKKCNDAPWWLFVVNTSSVCMIIIACTLRTYHCNVGFGGPLSTRPLYTPWGSPVGNANTTRIFFQEDHKTFQMINNNEECGKWSTTPFCQALWDVRQPSLVRWD